MNLPSDLKEAQELAVEEAVIVAEAPFIEVAPGEVREPIAAHPHHFIDASGEYSEVVKGKVTDPFAKPQIEDVIGENTGVKTSMRTITLVDDNGEPHLAGNVSSRYMLIPNADLVKAVKPLMDQTGWNWQKHLMYWDGHQYAMVYSTNDVTNGDYRLTLGLWNSYNKAWSPRVIMGALNSLCINLAMSGTVFGKYVFRHTENHADWPEQLEEAFKIMRYGPDQLGEFVQFMEQLKQTRITPERLAELRAEKFMSNIEVTRWGYIMDKFLTGKDYTAFGLYQAVTNVYTHGSFARNSFDSIQRVTDGFISRIGSGVLPR